MNVFTACSGKHERYLHLPSLFHGYGARKTLYSSDSGHGFREISRLRLQFSLWVTCLSGSDSDSGSGRKWCCSGGSGSGSGASSASGLIRFIVECTRWNAVFDIMNTMRTKIMMFSFLTQVISWYVSFCLFMPCLPYRFFVMSPKVTCEPRPNISVNSPLAEWGGGGAPKDTPSAQDLQ